MQRAFTRNSWLVACGVVSVLVACNRTKSDSARETGVVTAEDSGKGGSTAAAERGKIPLTTSSEEARQHYDRGLALADQLRAHEARQLFQQAVAKDPDFAMAHHRLALSAPTPKEFRAHLDKAVALSGNVSEGERLTILGLQAAANADPAKSLDYAKQRAARYPEDPRAHSDLGNSLFFGHQDYEKARGELQKAIDIDPNFSPAYNMLGYSHRFLGNYPEAENAFKKYIELVPNDPNPYDSYAELLMKTGRFDESIAQYRKALAIDPHFNGSYFGIASDLMFQGKHDQALAEAQKIDRAARNDGDRRFAMFTRTLVYVDQGKTDQALKEMQKQYDLGARIGDTAAMAGDAESTGDILLNAGKPDEARARYEQALSLQEKSGLASEVKEDAKLAHHYNLGRVALKKNDLATAKTEAAAYLDGAKAKQNPARIRQAHQLAGMIALKEKKFDQAISELEQANRQDPYVLYKTAVAYQGKGDTAKANEMFKQAAESYTLPTLSYVFIRAKAKEPAAPRSTS
jgi:tetratricopeptide (TPR) repeat protein